MKNNSARHLGIAVGLACCLTVHTAVAVPIIDSFGVFRADRSENPIGFAATSYNVAARVTPGGAGTTVTLSTLDGANNLVSLPVAPVGAGVFANQYIRQFPYDPTLTNDWTLTATDGTDTVTATRPGFAIDAMPFVEDILFTGTGSDITVHWSVGAAGASRLDEQQVAVWDLTDGAAPVAVQFFGIGAAARALSLGSLNLALGTPYAVEIQNVDRNGSTGYTDAFSGMWLTGWTPTEGEVQLPVTVPEPGTIYLLLSGVAALAFARRKSARA